jgi:hypothetical protein
MRIAKYAFVIGLLAVLTGCGNSDTTTADAPADDRALIQESLSEIITRWHYGDLAGLYDNEFSYLQDRMTFDDYIKTREMQLDADTVEGIVAKEFKFFGRDSADVGAEITFKGPKGKISVQRDTYRMYFYRGRWIRPTLSLYATELEYQNMRRAYDSAAEAEAKELGDD